MVTSPFLLDWSYISIQPRRNHEKPFLLVQKIIKRIKSKRKTSHTPTVQLASSTSSKLFVKIESTTSICKSFDRVKNLFLITSDLISMNQFSYDAK